MSISLNPRQLEAIAHNSGPMLVVAGAGTGKTTVLVERMARLIREKRATPEQVLALTYNINAAEEMRQRVQGLVGSIDARGLRTMTFHAYCNGILERTGNNFGVLDEQDLWIFLRQRIRELHLKHYVSAANLGKFLQDLLKFICRCQDELVDAAGYEKYVQRLRAGELPLPRVSKSKNADQMPAKEVLERCQEIACVFATVERMLKRDDLGTYGNMILGALQVLQKDAATLEKEKSRARFILIDEFQDANVAQIELVAALGAEKANVFAVGDPDQAIYRFRGASSTAFDIFRHRFPATKIVKLEQNQRSTTPILQCAFQVISKNPPLFSRDRAAALRYERQPLISARDEAAGHSGKMPAATLVEIVLSPAMAVEAADIRQAIVAKRAQLNCRWSDFAVLYRLHRHREALEQEMAAHQVPFSVESMDVLNTPQVRDLLACLGAVESSADSASLFRVAALPQFGIDAAEIRDALKRAPENSRLSDLLEKLTNGKRVLQAVVEARRQALRAEMKGAAVFEIVVGRFEFDAASHIVGALRTFIADWEKKALTRTGTLAEFLEYLEYFPQAGGELKLAAPAEQDAVRLMTAHAAKGLEFGHVFVIRANSGSFPNTYKEHLVEFPKELLNAEALPEDESCELHLQEERRLFYVAMTRARDSLALYAKPGRGKNDSTPAGFLRELLKEKNAKAWLSRRDAAPLRIEVAAAAAPVAISHVGTWLQMDPARKLKLQLSATAIERYQTCPLQFKIQREWDLPGETPAAMQFGAVMHLVLKAYYDAIRLGRPMSDDAAQELFRLQLRQAQMEDPYQRELYEQRGGEQLLEFMRARRQEAPPEIIETEQAFSVSVGEAIVTGRLDRIDRICGNRVAIIDYKTGTPRTQEDADESLQLSIYAIAAREKWGYRAERLVFYNLEDNSAVVSSRSEQQLSGASRKVTEVAAQIAAGEFAPTVGYHCNWCAYHNLCPETEKRLYSIVQVAQAGKA